MSLAKKGIAFCKSQVCCAATKFKAALTGSGYEECLNIEDNAENGDKDVDDYDDDHSDSTGDYSDDDMPTNYQPTPEENVDVVGENGTQFNTFSWKFPSEISQSTLHGRNGSSACSVIAIIFAHGVWHERLDLQPLRSLCPLWIKLLLASIRVGNRLYDRCRHSLPHRFLSAAEAASVAEQCVSVSVGSPLAVRVSDEHAQTTLQHQLSILCNGPQPTNAALFIVNEKTVLFLALESGSIVLVDTHRHGMHGAEILLGQAGSLYQFVIGCQKLLDMRGHTYGNLSFITF